MAQNRLIQNGPYQIHYTKMLTYNLKKRMKKEGDLKNVLKKKLKDINLIDPEYFVNEITKNSDLIAMIVNHNQEIEELKTMGKSISTSYRSPNARRKPLQEIETTK